jgi:hypothetical protein
MEHFFHDAPETRRFMYSMYSFLSKLKELSLFLTCVFRLLTEILVPLPFRIIQRLEQLASTCICIPYSATLLIIWEVVDWQEETYHAFENVNISENYPEHSRVKVKPRALAALL